MSARIQTLKDINEEIIYPVTSAKAVYMPDKQTTVYDEVNTKLERSGVTEFLASGDIVTTYDNNDTLMTSFASDGRIIETYRYNGTDLYYTRTTSFEDGKVIETIEYAEGVGE